MELVTKVRNAPVQCRAVSECRSVGVSECQSFEQCRSVGVSECRSVRVCRAVTVGVSGCRSQCLSVGVSDGCQVGDSVKQ